jgi:tetratricopeptide (TPR) repeat protein
MSAKIIKSALGLLQDDPDQEQVWRDLVDEVRKDPEMTPAELSNLLDAARRAHQDRRELDAVVRLLEIELGVVRGTPREPDLLVEMARLYDEELLDDAKARAAFERLAELRPEESRAAESLERSEAKKARWRDLYERYALEARGAGDAVFRSSLLVSAAEVAYRYGRDASDVEPIAPLLREALSVDPKNRRAATLLERVLREQGQWEELAQVLERAATETIQKDERVATWVRLARVLAKKVGSRERAAAAYERVLDIAPGHSEAASFLAEYFHASGMWDHLVSLYEGQLAAGALRSREEEFGATLQIAMVHWRMRGQPDAAEPWFERLRRIDPSHPGMLGFYREWCGARGDPARLAAILADAQRAMPDGPERAALVAEMAKLAEGGENAQRAIEQWRAVLRQSPGNLEAREALARLYRQTSSWNALTDQLRQDLDRLPQEAVAARLAVLRDMSGVYREQLKSDSALVTVLTQIVQLAPTDLNSVRELVRVYESLQRWRDLLAMQARQAELEPDPAVQVALWRAIARRWLDQFSNVQNAVDAYEKLRRVDPSDAEAAGKLKELYSKRRAYRPLYDLLEGQADALPPGEERRALWFEMAKLAAERLDSGSQAIALYKRVLEEDPASATALDALEKQAERDKDFAAVADVLQRRVDVASDGPSKLAILQKLGSIYLDRVRDPAQAVATWKRVLAIQPGHPKALRVLRDSHLADGDYDGLTELYAQTQDWEGLAEVLSAAADKATDAALKVELSLRCAALYVDRLHAAERAFRSYERVLSVKPDDERAAAALVPLYERDEKWGRLPALYEILLARATDVDARLELLRKLVDVHGRKLQDRAAAFLCARQAYDLAPERDGALAVFESAAAEAGRWDGFVDVLKARLASLEPTAEPVRSGKKKKRQRTAPGSGAVRDEARALRAKLAEVYVRDLGRVDDAIAIYRSLVEEDDGDEQTVLTLDGILRAGDRRDDLRWLFDVRVERANTAFKLDLLEEWAVLEEEAFGEPAKAIELLRRILEIVPQHGMALRSLARLLRAQGDARGAADVLAIDRDQRQGPERATREIELARLLCEPLHDYSEALAACERALAIIPNDGAAIEVVEGLLPVTETRARAAALLERIYGELGAAARQSEVLEVLLGTSSERSERLALYSRLADVREHGLSNPAGAFDAIARAVSEFPQAVALWDRLESLSIATDRPQAFADALVATLSSEESASFTDEMQVDLAERAAGVFEERLGDIGRARPYLERVLSLRPGHERSFQRLRQILTTQESWDELGSLYERVIGATADGSRRAELLAEIALVAEEITGERAKAISYYERILDIQPDHEVATQALDGLYAAEEQWNRLAALLERRLARAPEASRVDLELRLGTLHFDRLADASTALDHLESVLRARPSTPEATRLVERLLGVPEVRSRAATVLEAVYTHQDEVADLVRVLEIRLEFALDGDERRLLVRRIAVLRDERLRDDPGAFEAYARLLPLDPDDERARSCLLDIARRIGGYPRAVEVLSATAAEALVPFPRADILMDVARLYETQLGEVDKAEAVYGQVLRLAPEDATIALPACRALERIYAASGDDRRLCDVLRQEVRLESSAEARRVLRGRIGELCEAVLGDAEGAIAAWRDCLEDDPGDRHALAALDRLYERTSNWRALVEVLRATERLAEDANVRRSVLVRIAAILADKLGDVGEAILSYRTVVDDFGMEIGSLASLATLYGQAGRWQDLADTLEAEIDLAANSSDKIQLLARLGEVRQTKLGEQSRAIESYRQALMLDPSHESCRAALEVLLDDDTVRREAASILRPLYEADGLHRKLLKVLDIETLYAESTADKLATIAQASRVAELSLADAGLAFAYAASGLRESVAEADLPQWVERAERLASEIGKYADLADLLRSVVGEILDEELQLEITLRIADIARSQLSDLALAKSYYVKALDIRSDDRRALVALESLYRETGSNDALLEILQRCTDVAESDDERRTLLFKQARLCDEKLSDVRGAIGVYERILDLGLDSDALTALERLYTQAQRWDDLIALYERQLGSEAAPAGRSADIHYALGRVYETRVGEFMRAFDEYRAALDAEPMHSATVSALESLMAGRDHAALAAEMLEPVYMSRLDWRRVMSTLQARLDASQDPEERRSLLQRLAKMQEEQEEDYAAALETTARLLAEDRLDEGTWAELERLARVSSGEARLAQVFAGALSEITADEPATARLSKRTGELFEAFGDVDRALSFYRRAYEFNPEAHDGSFESMDRLLRAHGRARERAALVRESLDYLTDPVGRLAALHTIAAIEESDLHDLSAAIETYRACVETDEGDLVALDALSRLYGQTERWRELADLTRRRAEETALPEDEARFRMDLARLLWQKLDDVPSALDELQAVVDMVQGGSGGPGAEAVEALETLLSTPDHKARIIDILRPVYERADDWRKLISLNDERLALAVDDGERIETLRESAALWQERGHDPSLAFDAVRRAWALDPEGGDLRAQIDRLAEATGRWDDLAEAYETAIARTEGSTKRELLAALAGLHDKKRDDPRSALQAWGRLSLMDEGEIGPLEAMDSLATLLSDWATLVQVLTKKAELQLDNEARTSTWRRIGEALRDMIEDVPAAIDAYERALEISPDSAVTVDDLITLYEEKNDSARLVDLYRRRVGLCVSGDDALKFELLMNAAGRFERDLSDRREAIECLREALSIRPGDGNVLRKVDALYTQERMWPELLENLKLQMAAAGDEVARRALAKRIAALYASELNDPVAALHTYREVLDSAYDSDAVGALLAIGESHDELRAEAATTLEPVLRAAGRYAELASALELRLRAESEPSQRCRTLRSVAEVAETLLNDLDGAQDALVRALVEDSQDAELHAQVCRLAERIGPSGWRKYAEALDERARSTFDTSVAGDLFVRLGKVCELELGDPERAARAYVAAVDNMGDAPALLEALDRLYTRTGETRKLSEILERRIAVEEPAGAKADLLYRLGVLQMREFGEKALGLATLRQALERSPDHAPSRVAVEALLEDDDLFEDVFDALELVYDTLGSNRDLASLYRRRVDRAHSADERTRAELDLAGVIEQRVGDPAGAQRVLATAVVEDPTSDESLSELERLAGITQAWKDAAEALAKALEADSALTGAARTERWTRLANWRRDHLGDPIAAEEAYVRALAMDPENLEVLRCLEAVRRAPGRERDLLDVIRARARLEVDFSTRRELLREGAGLAQTALGDPSLAETVLRELIAQDEADDWALGELTRLRRAAGDAKEVVRLLLRRSELAADGAQATALKHEAARVMLGELRDVDGATALYQEILDADPYDAEAAAVLRKLYDEGARFKDLAKLLELLIDVAPTPEARASLRLELARLYHDRIRSPEDAVEVLRDILQEEPTHPAAVVELSRLYEETGRDGELVDLLKDQLEEAREREDVGVELALLVRLGELEELRLGDSVAAARTYEQVLERDPGHRGALEAVARMSERREDWRRAANALAVLVDGSTDAAGSAWALRLAEARDKFGDTAGAEDALRRGLALEPSNPTIRARLRVRWDRAERWSDLADLLVGDAEAIAAAHVHEEGPSPHEATTRPATPLGKSSPSGKSMPPGSMPPPPPVSWHVAEQVKLLRNAAEIQLDKRHSPADAIPIFERASALVPEDRTLLLSLCDAYAAAGRGQEAAHVLERVIASFGNRRTKELAVYHHRLAQAKIQLGDKESALAQLDLAFKIDPSSIAVLRDLGLLALETGDWIRAQKTFRALLLQRLDDNAGISKAQVFCYLGEVSAKQGDKPKAVQMFERAIENDPKLDRARVALAELKG